MFGDDPTLKQIMSSKSPGEMKALGEKVNNFNKVVWENSVTNVANKMHHTKFGQNPHLADYLLATGDNELLEASPNKDSLWGIGILMFDPMILTKQSQLGNNIQGLSLMKKGEQSERHHETVPLHILHQIILTCNMHGIFSGDW